MAFIAEIGLTPDGKLRRSKIFSASGVKLIDRIDAIDPPTTWKPDEWTARHFAWRYCYDALVNLILDKEKEEAENPQLF